jgi:hypothetical protein
MDRRLANLKAGLANISNDILQDRTDTLMRSLQAAAGTYEADKAKSAAIALDAVTTFLHDERLEAPFRFLVDVLDKSQRKGRRTKPLNTALQEARLAARVDALMESKGISLEQACRDAARETGGIVTWKQLKDLRENIRRGKARPEATEVYKHQLRRDRSPADEPPAPLAGPKKRNRKRGPKP